MIKSVISLNRRSSTCFWGVQKQSCNVSRKLLKIKVDKNIFILIFRSKPPQQKWAWKSQLMRDGCEQNQCLFTSHLELQKSIVQKPLNSESKSNNDHYLLDRPGQICANLKKVIFFLIHVSLKENGTQKKVIWPAFSIRLKGNFINYLD